MTKAQSIIRKSFEMEPMKVTKGTRGNNNQGGTTERTGHFLRLRKNSQSQFLNRNNTILDIWKKIL